MKSWKSRASAAEGIVKEDRPTTVKTRIVAHNQQIVRFDRESRKAVLPSSIELILKYIKSEKNELGAIVISDYNKGIVSEQLLDGIRQITKGTGIVTCVDPKRRDLSIYRGMDVITPNHLEAEAAMGIEDINGQEPRQGGAPVSSGEGPYREVRSQVPAHHAGGIGDEPL